MRSPGLRAAPGRILTTAWRFRYVLLPAAAIALVVAVQLFSQMSAPASPAVAPVPAAEGPGADPLTNVTPGDAPVVAAAVDTSDTDRRIAFWQDRLQQTPRSDTAWTYLGDLFDLKGRQTGDLSNYAAARDAYTKAVEISVTSPTARLGLARINVTLHDFQAALLAATNVLESTPAASAALAIMFDSAYELGDLDIARNALDQLKARSASPAVMVREARMAFVMGDTATAVSLSARAAETAESQGDTNASVAFYRYAAGEYALLSGDPAAAAAAYRSALELLPGYALAIAGEGRAAVAQGDLDGAIGFLEAATSAVPRPDHVALLGDLYAMAGRSADAEGQYATVEFIHDLAAQDGAQVYDREYANFLSDHSRDGAQALALAQAEADIRHDPYGYDTQAWALHANGRDTEALTAIRQALALGTADGRLLIHAGLIELGNGLTADGKAHLEQGLALKPAISPLVIATAKEALGQ
jgi:tetratricopeptide (TPR) repeat protein